MQTLNLNFPSDPQTQFKKWDSKAIEKVYDDEIFTPPMPWMKKFSNSCEEIPNCKL